jgi:hypothetical protein
VFISRQLGHTNAAITLKVYAHLFDGERHAALARERLEADYGALLTAPTSGRLVGSGAWSASWSRYVTQ